MTLSVTGLSFNILALPEKAYSFLVLLSDSQ